jgi:hypothetical protein
MRMLKFIVAPALILGLVIGLAALHAADEAPKYSIKEVMKMAHQGDSSLYKKVSSGKGSKEDKKKLVDLYTALAADTPKKGDADSWKDKTGALLDAAKAVEDDKDGAVKDLKKAADCKACHDVFRPKKN